MTGEVKSLFLLLNRLGQARLPHLVYTRLAMTGKAKSSISQYKSVRIIAPWLFFSSLNPCEYLQRNQLPFPVLDYSANATKFDRGLFAVSYSGLYS